MGYTINGVECDVDEENFLLEADFSDEAVTVIAAAEGVALTDDHWVVINYLREKYRDDGHTPNFRNMTKELEEIAPDQDWKKTLYDLFPQQPARQAARIAGLTKPYGKGGY
ncbi:MAG: putative sulfite reductase gamma chain [Rhodocyclaceae bacterium]|nr:putative sulfite reductase gamma chain [Rhodocyclaceae bacterium]